MNAKTMETYYNALLAKDLDKATQCLHPDIDWKSPLGQRRGRDHVIESARGFAMMLEDLKIRQSLGSDTHAMLAMDFKMKDSDVWHSGAAYASFKDGLMHEFELLFDPRPFVDFKG